MIVLESIAAVISFLEIGFSNLVYYTVLSNLLALFVSIISLKCPEDKNVRMARYGTTVCLTLTFVVVFFIFVPFSIPSGTQWNLIVHGPQFLHHVLCPLLAIYAFCKKRYSV